LTKKQIYDYFIWSSKNDNPNFSRQQHRNFAREWCKISEINNKKSVEDFMKKSITDYYQHIGILSLTENHKNDYTRVKYAENEQGFCIGYNTKILFNYLGMGSPVEYVDELPIIYPEPFRDSFTSLRNRIYYKHKKWLDEEEYRTSKFFPYQANKEDRQIVIPKEAFNRIIIGNKMSEANKTQLKSEIIKNIGNIEIIER
jgi:hypothetical protein